MDFIYSLVSGFILVLAALSINRFVNSFTHPAVTYCLVWGGGLILTSLGKFFGLYTITSSTLLFYILSAFVFSFSSLVLSNVFKGSSRVKHFSELDSINYKKLTVVYALLTLVSMPFIIMSIMSHGGSLVEIAYNLRVAALNNQPVLSPVISYYYVLSLPVSLIVLYGVVNKRISVFVFILVFLPFIFTMLLINGRSGLVSLILSWFFAYSFLGGAFSWRIITYFSMFMFSVIILGALFVSKVDVDGTSWGGIFFVMFEHIMDYYLQGVILFDLYINSSLDISENWDTLNSVCQVVAILDLCVPLPQHQDVAQFGVNKLGNVYSIYFSIYPKYGFVGIVFFMMFYGLCSSFLYYTARKGFAYCYVLSCYFFSFIVLSLFKDGFGYSFILYLQTFFFTYLVVLLFGKIKLGRSVIV